MTDDRHLRPAPEPPYDPDYDTPTTTPTRAAEQALLGALLTRPDLTPTITTLITPGDFQDPTHTHLYNLLTTTPNPDPITLTPQLLASRLRLPTDPANWLHGLITSCPNPHNAHHYATQVRNHARLRTIDNIRARLGQLDTTNVDTIDQVMADALDTLDHAALRLTDTHTPPNTGQADLTWLTTGEEPPTQPPPRWATRTDGTALFYTGVVNGVFGDPEHGKTWLAQIAIVEALHAGGTAAMIDVDHNGPNHTAARLLLLGAQPQHLADPNRFRYYEPEEPDQLLNAVTDITTWAPDITVLDSLGEIFPMLGVSTNDGDEMTTAMRKVCNPPATAGSCVITIDHLPKSTEARTTGYAIGSIAKKRAVRGAYIRAEARQKPAPGAIGRITLRIEKDTPGELRRASNGGYAGTLTIDSTHEHATTWTIAREEPPKNADGTFRPTGYMEKVSTYIAEHPGCSGRDIEEGIYGTAKHVRNALTILITEGHVSRQKGPHRSWQHTLIAPYREAEDDHAQLTL